MKTSIRKYLQEVYGAIFDDATPNAPNEPHDFSFLDSDEDDMAILENDDIEAFFTATTLSDKSISNVIEWWGQTGSRKYPNLSKLARNTLMTMGSSVASESTFSDSGAMIRSDRIRLSDDRIRILVTLRSWNRLLGYC